MDRLLDGVWVLVRVILTECRRKRLLIAGRLLIRRELIAGSTVLSKGDI